MKIAVIGSGNIAQALVNWLISEKYVVSIGSRNSDKNDNISKLKKVYTNITITTYTVAVKLADIILFAIPGAA